MFGVFVPPAVGVALSRPAWAFELGVRPVVRLQVDGVNQRVGGGALDLQFDVAARYKDARGKERIVLKGLTKNEGRNVSDKRRNTFSAMYRSQAGEIVPVPLDLQIRTDSDETQTTLHENTVGVRVPFKPKWKAGDVDFSESSISVGLDYGEREGTYLRPGDCSHVFRGVLDSQIVATLPDKRWRVTYTSLLNVNATRAGGRSDYIHYLGVQYSAYKTPRLEVSSFLRVGHGIKLPKVEPEAKTLFGLEFVYKFGT